MFEVFVIEKFFFLCIEVSGFKLDNIIGVCLIGIMCICWILFIILMLLQLIFVIKVSNMRLEVIVCGLRLVNMFFFLGRYGFLDFLNGLGLV